MPFHLSLHFQKIKEIIRKIITRIYSEVCKLVARIFYRNATNIGVPLLEAPGITELVENQEEIEVDMEKGLITNQNGESITFKKLPPFMLEILEQGGLIEYLKNKR